MRRLGLHQIDTTGADAGDVPAYDAATDRLVYGPPGGVGSIALDDLTDVDAPAPAPADVLTFDGAAWGPEAPAAGGTDADIPPAVANAKDDEFNDTTGMSGPVNGLDAKWSKRNLATASWVAFEGNTDAVSIDIPGGQAQDQSLYQTTPAGDFRLSAACTLIQATTTRLMFGIFIVDTSGNGISVAIDTDPALNHGAWLRPLAGWVQTPGATLIGRSPVGPWQNSARTYLSLRKSGGTYYGAAWSRSTVLATSVVETSIVPSAFTPAYVGIGQVFHATSANPRSYLANWFRVS